MDTPIKLEMTLEARDGQIRGTLIQSGSGYTIEIRTDGDGLTLGTYNRGTGKRDELDTGLTVEEAITSAMHAMGALAHLPFPGFEPVQSQEG